MANACAGFRDHGKARAAHWPQGEWEPYRGIILDLYLREEHTMAEVAAIMTERFNFSANIRQYGNHLKKWGVRKKVPGHVRRVASRKRHQNPSRTSFTFKSQSVTEPSIRRYEAEHPEFDPASSPTRSTPSGFEWESGSSNHTSPAAQSSSDFGATSPDTPASDDDFQLPSYPLDHPQQFDCRRDIYDQRISIDELFENVFHGLRLVDSDGWFFVNPMLEMLHEARTGIPDAQNLILAPGPEIDGRSGPIHGANTLLENTNVEDNTNVRYARQWKKDGNHSATHISFQHSPKPIFAPLEGNQVLQFSMLSSTLGTLEARQERASRCVASSSSQKTAITPEAASRIQLSADKDSLSFEERMVGALQNIPPRLLTSGPKLTGPNSTVEFWLCCKCHFTNNTKLCCGRCIQCSCMWCIYCYGFSATASSVRGLPKWDGLEYVRQNIFGIEPWQFQL